MPRKAKSIKEVTPQWHGLVVSIDQASNAAGVSVWRKGEFVGSTTLRSRSSKDTLGQRLSEQSSQLSSYLTNLIGSEEVNVVLFERVKLPIVLATIGAFTCVPQLVNCRFEPRLHFVGSMQWKKYAKDRGSTQAFKDIKGLKALRDIGWDFNQCAVSTDDEADSVMIYLSWKAKNI